MVILDKDLAFLLEDNYHVTVEVINAEVLCDSIMLN